MKTKLICIVEEYPCSRVLKEGNHLSNVITTNTAKQSIDQDLNSSTNYSGRACKQEFSLEFSLQPFGNLNPACFFWPAGGPLPTLAGFKLQSMVCNPVMHWLRAMAFQLG
jgi:hypothetical protein